MAVLAMNNAWGQLSTAMTAQTNTLTLQAGQASRFPVILIPGIDWFYVTIFDNNGNQEIAKVIQTQGDQFTVARGVDGTTAMSWAAAQRVQLNITAGFWSDFTADIAATATALRTFNAPIVLNAAPTTALQAATRKYVTDQALPISQPVQPPIGFSPVRQGTGSKIQIGWNGADLFMQANGGANFLGNVWRDSTYNPATKANAGSQCQWNAGIVQTGPIDWENTGGGSQILDTVSPWVLEGYTSQLSVNGHGGITSLAMYARLMWVRNQ